MPIVIYTQMAYIIILKGASDTDSLFESLERELCNVDHWLSINKMTINTKKLRLFSLGIRHISRNLTTKLSTRKKI